MVLTVSTVKKSNMCSIRLLVFINSFRKKLQIETVKGEEEPTKKKKERKKKRLKTQKKSKKEVHLF